MGFIADTTPWNGGQVSSRVTCVRANNPSPMTYVGTNTWILAEPDCPECIVIDPSPGGEHAERVLQECVDQGLRVGAIILSHCHADHTEGAEDLQNMTAARIYTPFDGTLPQGKFVPLDDGPELEVIALPGHSSDSVGIIYKKDNSMFTGDVLFRHGPTVVYAPDGVLKDYMESLDTLEEIAKQGIVTTFLPGHGYPITDLQGCIDATRQHRIDRLKQIKQALAEGVPAKDEALVDACYGDTDERLRFAALRSVQAQLKYLGLWSE